jgi:hypothetical protein
MFKNHYAYEQEYEEISLFGKSHSQASANSSVGNSENVWVLRNDNNNNNNYHNTRESGAIPVTKPTRNSSRISNYQHDLWQQHNPLKSSLSKNEAHETKPTKAKKNVHYAPFLNQG